MQNYELPRCSWWFRPGAQHGRRVASNVNWFWLVLAGVGLGSVWGRFGIDLGSVWGRFGVGLGSVWDRFGVDLGSVRGRFILNVFGPFWSLPSRTFPFFNICKRSGSLGNAVSASLEFREADEINLSFAGPSENHKPNAFNPNPRCPKLFQHFGPANLHQFSRQARMK